MITFKQKDDKHISVLCGGKEVGAIFTPGGSGESGSPMTIQVCGFDYAYDLWGCANYSGESGQKRDIQLLYNSDCREGKMRSLSISAECHKCFNKEPECTCNELKVFREKEVVSRKI